MLYTFSYETLIYKISHLKHSVDFNSHDFYEFTLKKNPTYKTCCRIIYKSECPQIYKIAPMKDMINRAKIFFTSHTLFSKELSNIKQKVTKNQLANDVVGEQIKLINGHRDIN